jgi:hypothetical protein
MHIKSSPRLINIDHDNTFGFGHRALAHSSVDRRKFWIIAPSIKDFLEDHLSKLKSNWYMTLRGNIETYANNPTDELAYGSVTITNGVRITAVAFYNHLISEFDSVDDPLNGRDTYVFSY